MNALKSIIVLNPLFPYCRNNNFFLVHAVHRNFGFNGLIGFMLKNENEQSCIN